MLSFVKIDNHNGIWANKDAALAFMEQGYHVYRDSEAVEELSKADIEAMSECDTAGTDTIQMFSGEGGYSVRD